MNSSYNHKGIYAPTLIGAGRALRDINLAVWQGEFISLVGPSGCGKSTLLRVVAGMHERSAGIIMVVGKKVTKPIPNVGMVFQAAVLLKWRTILDNVLLPAEPVGLSPRNYRERAMELLELAGLKEFASKLLRELSGGMQQRAAACRGLCFWTLSSCLWMSHSALIDAMTHDQMNLELLRIWGEASYTRKTILFVTHSIPEAVFLSDRVVIMSPRPGRIDIDLPRPRTVESRITPEFGALSLKIYDMFTGRQSGDYPRFVPAWRCSTAPFLMPCANQSGKPRQ